MFIQKNITFKNTKQTLIFRLVFNLVNISYITVITTISILKTYYCYYTADKNIVLVLVRSYFN